MAELTTTNPVNVPFTLDSPAGVALVRADRVRTASGRDLESELSSRSEESSGQSAAEVAASIAAALDALIGDDSRNVTLPEPWTFNFPAVDADDGGEAQRTMTDSDFISFSLTSAEDTERQAGASYAVTATVRYEAPLVAGRPAFVSVGGVSLEPSATVVLRFNVTAKDVRIPAVATFRGRTADGTVRVSVLRLETVGSHEVEFETLIQRLINQTTVPLDTRLKAADANLQGQITAVAQNLLSDTNRRVLRLFTLLQNVTYSPYAVPIRNGSAGAFSDPAVSTFTPTGTVVEVQLPISEAQQYAGALSIRQVAASGAPQDLPFTDHAHGSSVAAWTYQFTVRANVALSVVRLVRTDTLQVLENVAQLMARLNDLSSHLGAGALALLDGVDLGTLTTRAVARTALLSHLTVTRVTLTGSGDDADADPWVSPALNGGEFIIATRSGSSSRVLVEAYLSANAKINLVEIDTVTRTNPVTNADESFQRITVPYLIPATAARQANQSVYLHGSHDAGQSIETYRLDLTSPRSHNADESGLVLSGEFLFAVPDSVAAGTSVTVSIRAFANEVETTAQNRNFTVVVGGAADGAEQSYRVANVWTVSVQYVIESGRKFVRFEWNGAGSYPHQAYWYLLVTASYIATVNIAAEPASIGRQTIYQGVSFSEFAAILAVKVTGGGNLALVLEDAPGHGFLEGEFDTGLRASTYGLHSGGTGVLRFTNASYREMVGVTAGDLAAADLAALRPSVNAEAFGIGLFTDADEDDQVFRFDRAIQAPRFFQGEQSDEAPDGVEHGPSNRGLIIAAADSVLTLELVTDPADNSKRLPRLTISADGVRDLHDVAVLVQWRNSRVPVPTDQTLFEASSEIRMRLGASGASRPVRIRVGRTTRNMRVADIEPNAFYLVVRAGNTNLQVTAFSPDFGQLPLPFRRYQTGDTPASYSAGEIVLVTSAERSALGSPTTTADVAYIELK